MVVGRVVTVILGLSKAFLPVTALVRALLVPPLSEVRGESLKTKQNHRQR